MVLEEWPFLIHNPTFTENHTIDKFLGNRSIKTL